MDTWSAWGVCELLSAIIYPISHFRKNQTNQKEPQFIHVHVLNIQALLKPNAVMNTV